MKPMGKPTFIFSLSSMHHHRLPPFADAWIGDVKTQTYDAK